MTQPRKGRVGVGGNNTAVCDRNELDESEINDNEVEGGKVDDKVEKKD